MGDGVEGIWVTENRDGEGERGRENRGRGEREKVECWCRTPMGFLVLLIK